MPVDLRERNSVLAVAALAYFTGVHSAGKLPSLLPAWSRRLASKEFLVGILFTAGCAAPVLSRLHSAGGAADYWPVLVAMAFFAALAWLNCRSIIDEDVRFSLPPELTRSAPGLTTISAR